MASDFVVYLLRVIVGMIWLVAAILTAILLAPIQMLMMVSFHIWQPQNVRY